MRKSTGYSVIAGLLLVAAEGLSYLTLEVDEVSIRKRLYRPPAVTREEFARYLEGRDDLLGWPSRDWLAEHADAAGARLSPSNERLRDQPVCVSTYGDSFTYGSEVGDESAWGDVLAKTLGCRVSNFGVPAYGMDQSILRFERNTEDGSELVILGFFTEDMNRNATQWFYLLTTSRSRDFTFKPRFLIDGQDQLRLEPIRIDSYEAFRRVMERPADVLTAEAYLPDGPSMQSKVVVSFPYSLTLLRLARRVFTQLDFGRVSPSRSIKKWVYRPWFDSPDGPSAAKVRLNSLLMRRFAHSCEVRRQRCVVLFIPGADEIESRLANRPDPVEEILRPMAREIELWDPTSYIAEHAKDRGACYYIGSNGECYGHYNAAGYALLAGFVAEKILGEAQAFR